jgi:ATP-dependent exoDNAse (exonuclease V) alpha subunit
MDRKLEIDNDSNEDLQPLAASAVAYDYDDDEPDEQEIDLSFDAQPVRCVFTTGAAGTGKTHYWRERIREDPSEGELCATTGIAGVNLGAVTINSRLRYFDTESMINAYVSGRLVTRLAHMGARVRNLIIDEGSMMPAEQLDTLYQATQEANRRKIVTKKNPDGLGLVFVGDFCQLPPVKARWAFEAECWKEFDAGTQRLEKNWRQADEEFLAAINYLRAGRGEGGAEALRETATEFTSALDLNFPGTTIMAKNDEVDRFNWQALQRVRGEKFTINSKRWHVARNPSEWKNIPERLELKIGAYVMILANDTREFTYANGDCGLVVGRDSTSVQVRLARNDEVVEIGSIERKVHSPDANDFGSGGKSLPRSAVWGSPWFDEQAEKYCIGSVHYLPLRLAWASTVHKSQGLTLDRVQLDLRNHFFSQPAMAYVAVSRCRTPEGLRIVGDEKLLASRCKIDPRVERWV